MRVIIAGSGIGGVTFAERYRSVCPSAQITLLTKENHGYYSRPLLSHGFSREGIEDSIILKSFDSLRENNINIISDVEVTEIKRDSRSVIISGAEGAMAFEYDKLILSLGSEAFVPPPFQPCRDCFLLLNNLADLKVLRRFRKPFLDRNQNPRWAIIGGGLIGCEVASDLAKSGDSVTLYHAMDRLMERQLVEEDSARILEVLESAGVKVLLNQAVEGFEKQDGRCWVKTGLRTEFDGVIVSCGFKPRTDLADQAELDTGRGIKVNQFLKTNDEDIFALGDVAELPNGKLYAFIMPIRSQALWLADYLNGQQEIAWEPPAFKPKAKVHGFEANHPYHF